MQGAADEERGGTDEPLLERIGQLLAAGQLASGPQQLGQDFPAPDSGPAPAPGSRKEDQVGERRRELREPVRPIGKPLPPPCGEG